MQMLVNRATCVALIMALLGALTLPSLAMGSTTRKHRHHHRGGAIAHIANTGPRDQLDGSRCMRKLRAVREKQIARTGIPPGAQLTPVKKCVRHRVVGNNGVKCLVAAGFGAAIATFGVVISGGVAALLAARLIASGAGFSCAQTLVSELL